MLLVMNHVDAMERAKPSQPTCSSQSLRFQMRDFGVPGGTVCPGIKMRLMIGMTTMGRPAESVMSNHGGTVSCSVKGKLAFFSVLGAITGVSFSNEHSRYS